MNRRELLKAAAALPLTPAVLCGSAGAQGAPYPSRNITMIVPFPAGGQADLAARPVAAALEKILGKSVIVDNRAGGGGGSVGNAAAARAEPDGYTLLMTLSSLAVLPEADRLFNRPVAYEVSQFAPVARVLADPTLLAVPANAPWKTLKDLVEDARKRPGQIAFSSSGLYGALHLPTALLTQAAGIQLRHLPTNGGGPALTAVLGNNAQALVTSIAAASSHMRAGKLRALACFSANRAAAAPEVPTLKELGHNVEFSIWVGLFAPRGTPGAVIQKLRDETRKAVAAEAFTKAIQNIGDVVAYLDQPEFTKFWDEDARRVEAAVQSIGKV